MPILSGKSTAGAVRAVRSCGALARTSQRPGLRLLRRLDIARVVRERAD